jgi:hypothetical protein
MRQINLLPSELKPSKQVSLVVKKAEKFFVGLLIIYLIMLGTAYVSKIYLDKKLNEGKERKSVLSNELKSLANVESSTVYIRDRVEKYNSLLNKDIELQNLKYFDKSYSFFPSDSKVRSIGIEENNISYSVSVTNLASFSHLLDSLVKSNLYKEIVLSDISYKENEGYLFNLIMSF